MGAASADQFPTFPSANTIACTRSRSVSISSGVMPNISNIVIGTLAAFPAVAMGSVLGGGFITRMVSAVEE